MVEIKSLTIDELKTALKEMGEKPFRAGQIFKWLHEGVESFEEMSNLSKDLRARLAENFLLTVPEVARKQVSRVDGTVKYLWRLRDGNCVESVLAASSARRDSTDARAVCPQARFWTKSCSCRRTAAKRSPTLC